MKERPLTLNAKQVADLLKGQLTELHAMIKPVTTSDLRPSGLVRSGMEDRHGNEVRPLYYSEDVFWIKEEWRMQSLGYERKTGERTGQHYAVVNYRGQLGTRINVTRELYRELLKHKIACKEWWPASLLPQWAARLRVIVTYARAERLHDITVAQIVQSDFDMSKVHDRQNREEILRVYYTALEKKYNRRDSAGEVIGIWNPWICVAAIGLLPRKEH